MSHRSRLEELFDSHAELVRVVRSSVLDSIEKCGAVLVETLANGGTVFIAGNGGSAADAQHFAAELVGRFFIKTRRALPGIALTVDTSALTAISNDFGYQNLFARQLEGLARAGDAFVGITTSGRSPNILAAMEVAHRMGLSCIGLVGNDASAVAPYCAQVVSIPHGETARVQEMHITTIHGWCDMIDRHFGNASESQKE
ncbi:MAG TPA: SIS domain-containing protein [Candidatus Sumerlaeota bacterium]|nr:SIS domain-containing protein [Candidatus Sumerlaeota bacterium]HMX63725.1 SIS domain-containing protein [Candidatus Sumerlaeota bacterium]HNM46971.1 SIS domain-containing protein [Candidatus Sumerlaeota bacterium]